MELTTIDHEFHNDTAVEELLRSHLGALRSRPSGLGSQLLALSSRRQLGQALQRVGWLVAR